MIDRNLLNYPEQLAVRLSQMERKIAELEREVKELKRKAGN